MDMNVMEFVRPELLVLIPVLYLLGMGLKKSEAVLDKRIPAILGTVGVLLSLVYLLSTTAISGYQDGLQVAFSAVTQGVLCAGTSVYVNQLVVQGRKPEK